MPDIAADPRYGRCGNVLADQKRSLLNMQFEIGRYPRCFCKWRALDHGIHGDADIGHVVAERAPVLLVERLDLRRGKRPHQRLGADIAGTEPGAFLAAHGQRVNGPREPLSIAARPQQAYEARDDAGKPVEIAALRHAVDMRPDHDIAVGVAIVGKGEIGVLSGIVPDLEPVSACVVLEEPERLGLDAREGGPADAFGVGRPGGDFLEQIARNVDVASDLVGRDLSRRCHGAASMNTTPAFCSPSITVPMISRTDLIRSLSR